MFIHLTDAHCHIDFSKESDYSQLRGVDVCVSACFQDDWALLQKFDKIAVYKAYGLHPYLRKSAEDSAHISETELFSESLPALQEFLISADALGEIGLDKRIENDVPIDLQEKAFCAQLDIAKKYNLPVIIHCVGKWGMLQDILKSWTNSARDKFLLHSASCSAELVDSFAEMGAYFSFGARELNSDKGMQCVKAVAQNRILIETDSLADAEKLSQTLKNLAEIRNENAIDLSEKIYSNFLDFYENE